MPYYPLYYQIDSGLNLAKAPIIMGSASGSIASFPDGAADLPVQSLKVDINPVQDLHGYDYPWPAGGGKNLFNYDNRSDSELSDALPASIITLSESIFINGFSASGYIKNANIAENITINATSISCTIKAILYGVGFPVKVKPETTYKMSWSALTGIMRVGFYDSQSVNIGSISDATNAFTTPQDCEFAVLLLTSNTANTNATVSNLQLEEGSTATSYAPYSNICPITGWNGANVVISPTTDAEDGTTYNITFPAEAGTVYGGTLTINEDGTGTLVVERATVVFDGSSDEKWMKNGGSGVYILVSTIPNINTASNSPIYSNQYEQAPTGPAPALSGKFNLNTNKTALQFRNINAMDVISFITQLALNPLELCYVITNPVNYHLTAPQIRTLLGTNNIWADTGDTAVTYRADTKLYIERLTQPDADMFADSNITSGKFFMIGNTLYLSTQAIAEGAAIVPGTNCTEMSLADALNSLNT